MHDSYFLSENPAHIFSVLRQIRARSDKNMPDLLTRFVIPGRTMWLSNEKEILS